MYNNNNFAYNSLLNLNTCSEEIKNINKNFLINSNNNSNNYNNNTNILTGSESIVDIKVWINNIINNFIIIIIL
jgi:hypothetical protein